MVAGIRQRCHRTRRTHGRPLLPVGSDRRRYYFGRGNSTFHVDERPRAARPVTRIMSGGGGLKKKNTLGWHDRLFWTIGSAASIQC